MSNKPVNLELLSKLQCIVLPGRARRCNKKYIDVYNSTYLLWKEGMIAAYASEGLVDRVNQFTSDDFVRHEECICLCDNNVPVAMLMFDWMNLDLQSTLDHSYFDTYPENIVNDLHEKHSLIMTIGHLVVHPDWRGRVIGPGIADIMTGFMTRRFLASPATALLFLTRNNRGTNALGMAHGAQALVSGITRYGIDADVLVVYRDTVTHCKIEGIRALTDRLWDNQINVIINPLTDLESNVEYIGNIV